MELTVDWSLQKVVILKHNNKTIKNGTQKKRKKWKK